MAPIIDVHSHLGQFTNAGMSADGERLCAQSRAAGIAHVVTFSIEACYGALDRGNRYTLDEVDRHSMLSAMVVAHPAHMSSSAAWIRQASSNPNIVGVKIHPVLGDYDVLDTQVMRLMGDHVGPSGLTVLSHVGNESPNVPIDKYLRLAGRFPQIRFIAAHLGVGIMGSYRAAANAWVQNPQANVWFDMGTMRAFCNGSVETLLEVVGPDRICFGTDAPLYRSAPFISVLQTLAVSEDTREKIAWRNALNAIPALASRVVVPTLA